ncbi:MAG: ferrous iron transport protein B [Coriobacteriia bacterium]|nr:ferrous iron transport protein B [Coriobacteriia bacterium]
MTITIALVGNPNSGKTTLFNALTGSNQYVGNWPGVTVEKKEGRLKLGCLKLDSSQSATAQTILNKHDEVIITDLPGIYSLSPYTEKEKIARDYLAGWLAGERLTSRPNTSTGKTANRSSDNPASRPDLILNIVDGTNLERNLYLTTQLVELGIPMVVAVNMMDFVEKSGKTVNAQQLGIDLGCPVIEISALKGTGISELMLTAVVASEQAPPVPQHSFSGIVEHTLAHIEEAALHSMPEEKQRWYAVKLFERDEETIERLKISAGLIKHIEQDIKRCEKQLDDDSMSIITHERYAYIDCVVNGCCTVRKPHESTFSNRIDRVVTNRYAALPIFALVMALLFLLAVTLVGAATNAVLNTGIANSWQEATRDFLVSINCADWLQGLILNGIFAGVGAVLSYVPQLLALFLLLAFLESCGYMARVAFILDRLFRRFGLSGKSFVPFLIGAGCGVTGIMAANSIENERDRKMTIITTTFVPCSAKLPIIALIASALFGGAWWVAPSAYFVGIAAIVCSGIILKKTRLFAGETTPFVMELPPYQLPSILAMLRSMGERGWSFIKNAGTIILLASIVVWFTSNFGWDNAGRFGMVAMGDSMLAAVGSAIAWIFAPLGWGDWRSAVAAVAGLLGKENIVSTFAVLYNFGEAADVIGGIDAAGKAGAVLAESSTGTGATGTVSPLAASYTALSAYSFLIFNLLCAPCVAAMSTIWREMKSAAWFWLAVGYQCGFAYVVALCFYQIGSLFAGGSYDLWTGIAVALLVFLLLLLVRPNPKVKQEKQED